MNRNLTVLKFGGSSLATPEQVLSVARKIRELHRSGEKLIVVTSAMGKTTDQLNELARKISKRPNRRELDMLLTTGERVSMALVSIALHDLECSSISFTGSQAGIMTDGSFTNAKITELKPIRVEEALLQNKIVVLAGFQGVDPATKEITTLGRGGSDTTAVAMASHFGARSCKILKDVDGVFSADPKIVPHAKLIKNISIDKLYEFCFWGAKVLNYRSVELARNRQVPLEVGRSDSFSIGTTVSTSDSELKKGQLLGVNSHTYVFETEIACSSSSLGREVFESTIKAQGIPPQQILRETFDNDVLKILVACDFNDFVDVIDIIKADSRLKLVRDDISTVTASFYEQSFEVNIVKRSQREAAIMQYFVDRI